MPGAVRAFPVTAAIRAEFAVVAITQQCIVVRIGFHVDAAAASAIAAGGPATRNIFLAAKSHAAVPAVAGLHKYLGFINEQMENSWKPLGRHT